MLRQKFGVLLVCICVSVGMFGAFSVNAQTRDYCSRETVYKTGPASAYSNSTGSNTFYVFYGATSTYGLLTAQVQYYNNGWHNLVGAKHDAGEGNTHSWSAQQSPYKLFRLALHNITALGNGWIEGQE
ncbi:MAG: hypothetical protein K2K96_00960 [Lachnospiraceae bacterium]|nr:hypothetical protein [Lachnospiraceae bacterium]